MGSKSAAKVEKKEKKSSSKKVEKVVEKAAPVKVCRLVVKLPTPPLSHD